VFLLKKTNKQEKFMHKPKIITVNTIRGGSGKTLFSILLGTYLEKKVLLIDCDIQNSLSFWSQVPDQSKNLFNAIINRDATANIQKVNELIDIIPSDIRLLDIQNLEPGRFDFLTELTDYEYIVVDTPPTYNGIIYNCFQISDIVILPCMLDLFSFKSISYTVKKIQQMKMNQKIKVLVNQYESSGGKNCYASQLLYQIRNHEDIQPHLVLKVMPKSVLFKQLTDGVIERIPEQKRTANLMTAIRRLIEEVR